MAAQIDSPAITVTASGTVAAFCLITGAGAAAALNANKDYVGVNQEAVVSGQTATVRLANAGTCKVTASEAILVGDLLYKAANGRVSKTATSSVLVGVALTAASGAGSVFEAVLF